MVKCISRLAHCHITKLRYQGTSKTEATSESELLKIGLCNMIAQRHLDIVPLASAAALRHTQTLPPSCHLPCHLHLGEAIRPRHRQQNTRLALYSLLAPHSHQQVLDRLLPLRSLLLLICLQTPPPEAG